MDDKLEKVKGYEVTVRGQYHAAQGRDKYLKNFGPESFFVPLTVDLVVGRRKKPKMVDGKRVEAFVPVIERADGLKAALHVIMRKLLPGRFVEKYPDAVAVRRCKIISSKRVEIDREEFEELNTTDVTKMSKGQLQIFCAENSLPVPVKDFSTVEEAREAVLEELQEKNAQPDAPAHEREILNDEEGEGNDGDLFA